VAARETLGTIIVVIVLSPFIVYLVNTFTGLFSWFDVGGVKTLLDGVPEMFKGVISVQYNIVSYLYNVLTNPQAVAVLIGIGIIIAAVGGGRD